MYSYFVTINQCQKSSYCIA